MQRWAIKNERGLYWAGDGAWVAEPEDAARYLTERVAEGVCWQIKRRGIFREPKPVKIEVKG